MGQEPSSTSEQKLLSSSGEDVTVTGLLSLPLSFLGGIIFKPPCLDLFYYDPLEFFYSQSGKKWPVGMQPHPEPWFVFLCDLNHFLFAANLTAAVENV
ncbi:MAG: hypothetical protein ACYC38_11745 [Eubacteriales bacterium]